MMKVKNILLKTLTYCYLQATVAVVIEGDTFTELYILLASKCWLSNIVTVIPDLVGWP